MNLTLPALIILLLPGFFALWVYQGFCYEDVHKRGETHMISLGLMFGMIALGVYALLDKAARYRLAIPFAENPAALISLSFAWKYAVLSGTALLVGLVSGTLSRSRIGTPIWWARLAGAKKLKINPTTTAESALNYTLQEMSKDYTSLLVGVSDYEGGPFKLLGWYHANSFDPRELVLSNTHLFRGLTGNDLQYVRSLPAASVLTGNGTIITIMSVTDEEHDSLNERLRERRKQIINSPSFYR